MSISYSSIILDQNEAIVVLLHGIADRYHLNMTIGECIHHKGGVDIINCSVRPSLVLHNNILTIYNDCGTHKHSVLLSISVCAPDFENKVVPWLRAIL